MAKKTKLRDPMLHLEPHHHRELQIALAEEKEVNQAPLSERQEARAEFLEAMKDPALVAERVGWMIDGNYGEGTMLYAKRIIASPRMNRRAALTHLVAIHEWKCPGNFAIDAWKKLTGPEKKQLDAALDVVIEAAEEEIAQEQGE